jgi:L-alanine-DL-glutamate epimerase-like enolase superfamily enzyme
MRTGQVETQAVVVPLRRPVTTASGKVDRAPLVLIDLGTTEGVVGPVRVNASNFVMPDVQQIGGVTGRLRAAAIAQAAGKRCRITSSSRRALISWQ